MCPPNYTKNHKVRNLLDTPDPEEKMQTVQTQSLRPGRTKSSVYKYRETRMARYNKEKDIRTFPFGSIIRRIGPFSKTKKPY